MKHVICICPDWLSEHPAFSSNYMNFKCVLSWLILGEFVVPRSFFVWLFCPSMEMHFQHSSSPRSPKCKRQFRCFQPGIFCNKKILLHQEECAYSGTWCFFQCICCWQALSCFLLFILIAEYCLRRQCNFRRVLHPQNSSYVPQFHLLRKKFALIN